MQTLMVISRPLAGREEDFNTWYRDVHVPDMLAIDGVKSCTRQRLLLSDGKPAEHTEYVALYEIDGDAQAVMQEMSARVRDGRATLSDAMNPAGAKVSVWETI
ncbi:DUF4286 family protein [Nocardia alni]|uniref:DUF4286 family protein n=1 Tax=Nocardia alni TaxID=2815723 RepID=UPI001C21B164|nr:DUF4286 family protein [Nocardia alni]